MRDNICEVFDILAMYIGYVNKNADVADYDGYDAMSKKEVARVKARVSGSLENYLVRNSETIRLNNSVDNKLLILLKNLYNELTVVKDINSIIQIIKHLDTALENLMQDLIMIFERKIGENIHYINSNSTVEQIGLLPRCVCRWERRSRGSQHHHRIDNYLHNLLFVDLKIMKSYELNHVFMKLNDNNRIMEREALNIAMSFVTNTCSFGKEDIEDDKVKKFNVVYMGDKSIDNQHILDLINLVSSFEADILLLPEMLGNDETLSVVQEELSMPPENGNRYPLITVLPTVWKDSENCAYVINQYGDLLFEQKKQIPYKDKENRIENIEPDYIINVLHCNHLGRIVVMICRDFLEVEHLQNIIYCVKPTLILLPSYSTGDFDFKQVEAICRNADCCVAWVNSCAALKSKNQCVGFVDRAGYGNYEGREQREEFVPCNEYDNKICNGCCVKISSINCIGKYQI